MTLIKQRPTTQIGSRIYTNHIRKVKQIRAKTHSGNRETDLHKGWKEKITNSKNLSKIWSWALVLMGPLEGVHEYKGTLPVRPCTRGPPQGGPRVQGPNFVIYLNYLNMLFFHVLKINSQNKKNQIKEKQKITHSKNSSKI